MVLLTVCIPPNDADRARGDGRFAGELVFAHHARAVKVASAMALTAINDAKASFAD
jgi:hypothetical protein